MAENSAVSVRRLTVRRGAHIALHGVDATIPRGSSTVLVGPNGAGKTTFLLSLLGELPHSGQIDILPLNGRAPRISFVPQYANPAARMPLTAAEFLSLDGNRRPLWLGLGRAARRRAARALEQVHAENLLQRPMCGLSGGESRRVLLAAALLRDLPGVVDVGRRTDHALAVSRRTHHRLHHTRHSDLGHRLVELPARARKPVRRCRQSELLGRQPPDTLAVHGQQHRLGRRHHIVTFPFEFDQNWRGYGLDLRNNVIRSLLLDDLAQALAVEHRQDIRPVRYLHRRRIGITVQGHHLDSVTLQFDGDLLAQFARTAQQSLPPHRCECCSYLYHFRKMF